jgi:hypothetical protein
VRRPAVAAHRRRLSLDKIDLICRSRKGVIYITQDARNQTTKSKPSWCALTARTLSELDTN